MLRNSVPEYKAYLCWTTEDKLCEHVKSTRVHMTPRLKQYTPVRAQTLFCVLVTEAFEQ